LKNKPTVPFSNAHIDKVIASYTGKYIRNPQQIKLLPYQAKIHLSTKKILAFIGGTGSGKTWYAPIKLWDWILQYPNEEWIICGATYGEMLRNIVKYTLKFFKLMGIKYYRNKIEGYIDVENGLATIYYITAKEPDRMQGIHCKGIIGDESGLYSKLWFDTAIQRLSFTRGQLFLTTTPYSMNWLYNDIFKPFMDGDNDIELVSPTSIDNPFYPVEEYLKAKKRLPSWKFNMLYNATFSRPAGLIFPTFTKVRPFHIPASWYRTRSLDFGFNNPTAILKFAQSPKTGKWYLYNEFKQSGIDNDQLEKLLRNGDSLIYADPSEKQTIQTFKRKGLPLMEAHNSVMAGITETYTGLKNKQLVIFDDCVHTIDELSTYAWKTNLKTDEILDSPVKDNDHCMDALRYFWYSNIQNGGNYTEVLDQKQMMDNAIKNVVEEKTLSDIYDSFGDDDF